MVDHFSHWVELAALPNIRASTIATSLYEEWCCRYGMPERLHSDGDALVRANEEIKSEGCFEEKLKILGNLNKSRRDGIVSMAGGYGSPG